MLNLYIHAKNLIFFFEKGKTFHLSLVKRPFENVVICQNVFFQFFVYS